MKILAAILFGSFAGAVFFTAAVFFRRSSEISRLRGEMKSPVVAFAGAALKKMEALSERAVNNRYFGRAGEDLSLIGFRHGVKRLFVLMTGAFLLAFALGIFLTENYWMASAMAAAAFFAPRAVAAQRAAGRREEIAGELPEAMDIISASVEGGASLRLALRRYASRKDTPLKRELSEVLKRAEFGMDFLLALADSSSASGSREYSGFTEAISLAEKSGGSIREVLEAGSEEIRNRRFMELKKRAHEAPVKLLVPLVIFIFPVVFMILFVPVIIRLAGGF